MNKSHTHAGGIVCKTENGNVLYLVVRPKKRPDEWVFPKGHIEAGEKATDAAVREVEEETGVVGRIAGPAGEVEFDTTRERVRAVFYLMDFVRMGRATEERSVTWRPYAEALEMLTHDSNKDLLRTAEKLRLARTEGV